VSNARSRLAAYGRTPKALLRDPDIRPIAKTVYTMVDEVAGHEDITVERMAEWLGVNVKTARRALHEIEQAGWVEVVTVVQGQRGQRPSEYVANAYPFQHLSEPVEVSGQVKPADQRKRAEAVPLPSTPQEKSGTPPYQKVPSTGVEQTGVPKSGTPRDYQKVVAPTYLRDDETNNPPTPQPSILSDDLGFSEFWGRYPPCEWKQRTSKTNLRGFWFNLTDKQRHLALRALDAYIASAMWIDKPEDIPGPKIFLENEPWLEAERGNLPAPPPPPVKYLTAADVRLTDEDD
jgi:hypothetical protein